MNTNNAKYKPAKLAILIVSSLFVAGCFGVPKTQISFRPASNTLTIKSPKDITMTNFVADLNTNGMVSIRIGSYSSANNAAVLEAVAKGNADTMQAIANASQQAVSEATKYIK